MVTIKYRQCEIAGNPAAAVLDFKESVAAAAQEVINSLNAMNATPANRLDDDIVLTDQTAAPLKQVPTGTVLLHSQPEQQGTKYRDAIVRAEVDPSRQPVGAVLPGTLIGAGETALLQYNFAEANPTDVLRDSSFYSKTASITGSSAQLAEGPLGYARAVLPGTHWTLPTGQALMDSSIQLTMLKGDMSCWAWVKRTSNVDNVVASYSSDASLPIAGTVSTSAGSSTITGNASTDFTTAFSPYDRIFVVGGPSTGYTVNSVTGIHSLEISGTAISTLTNVAAYQAPAARPFSPEGRNTLYELGVDSSGNATASWQYGLRQPSMAVNSAKTVPAGEYAFVGMTRRLNYLGSGYADSGSIVVTPTVPVGEILAGHWVQLEGLPDSYLVLAVFDSGGFIYELSVQGLDPLFVDPTVRRLSVVDCAVSVGLLDGTFSTQVGRGQHPATGGNESAVNTLPGQVAPDTIGALYVGYNKTTGTGFTGNLSCVTLFGSALDKELTDGKDAVMYRHFSRAFPDFVLTETAGVASLQRSPVSDITSGSTVYAQYPYTTSTSKAMATTDAVTGSLDTLVAGMGNQQAASISTLSKTIGQPDPAAYNDKTQLATELLAYGLTAGGGTIIPPGTTDISAFGALANVVGLQSASDLIAGKPNGWFIIIASTEERTIQDTVDACGVPSSTVLVTERLVGINRNLYECAVQAGFESPEQLKIRFWWIGGPTNAGACLARMRALGLTNGQQADAYALVTKTNFLTYVIRDSAAPSKIIDTVGQDAFSDMLTRPTPLVNASATTADLSTALQAAFNAGPGATIDGEDNGQDPALLIASVSDFDPLFKISELLDEVAAATSDVVNSDCLAMFACLEDLFRNLMRVLKVYQATVVPFAIHEKRACAAQKQALSRYIPCIGSVSASVAAPPFHAKVNGSKKLLIFADEQQKVLKRAANTATDRLETFLCIPRTLIAALRGGVCGIEAPKVLNGRECPTQIDMLLDRLQQLVSTVQLLIKKVLEALSSISVDVELSIGAATQIAFDAQLPCLGPVARLLINLG
jgi:hypothetical protein